MFQITGKTLEVVSEVINGPSGPFESTTIHLLAGDGANTSVERVRVGRDYRTVDLPKKDEVVTLNVVISSWAGKSGHGYRATALSRAASGGARLAATGS